MLFYYFNGILTLIYTTKTYLLSIDDGQIGGFMYEFTNDCLLNIDTIDDEHRHLFKLINDAFALIEETDDVTPVAKNLISSLKDYANTHFAHEEAYMESINDPELPLQKKEHAAFAAKIDGFKLDDSSPKAAKKSLNELLTYLVRWLYHHILSSDLLIGKMLPIEDKSENVFEFTDKYKTGIALVDDEHRRLFEIISDTNDLIHDRFIHDKYDEIMRLLSELREYTQVHFHDEEELMERIGYPGLEAQMQAHSAFVERLVGINLSELDEMDDNQQEYLLDLIQFLLSWLSNHILGADKKIGEFMREHNIRE